MADSEKLLALLCLSEDQNLNTPLRTRWTPQMQLAHRLLRAYDGRCRSLDSALREHTEHLDSTREACCLRCCAAVCGRARCRACRMLHVICGSIGIAPEVQSMYDAANTKNIKGLRGCAL